jgi:hypothetical protein
MDQAAELKSRGFNAEDDSVAKFLGFILNHDPKDRPTINQVIELNRPLSLVKADEKANGDQGNVARGLSVFSFILVVFLFL